MDVDHFTGSWIWENPVVLITYPRMSENNLALDIQNSYNEANG